jgi:acetylornithine deacetylase/succinyl-diaminopimelate desuccinylase-like protein
MDLGAADAHLRATRDQHLKQLQAFLRIPSVSALPAQKDAMSEAAEWLAGCLRDVGVPDVTVLPTAGNPVVCGGWHTGRDRPTVLLYGHYDVQPADPIAEWASPPFEPVVRDGCVFARGATDDKGALYMPLAALDAIRASGGAPGANLTLLFEGEEEIGSPNLRPFLREHRDRLRADLVVSADGTMWDAETPSLTLGSRGLAGMQIDVRGARSDLHSGGYGGAVPNPIHALVELLAGLHDAGGRVSVDGFYDDVRPLTRQDREEIARVPWDEQAYCSALGVRGLTGEAGYAPLERVWARPTLEVNGIWGGFQGDGTKTVLPAEAHAKITCRLVPDQDPGRIIAAIERHVHRRAPSSVAVSIRRFPGLARPYLMPSDHPSLAVAARVLKDVYDREPLRVRLGGTLPVADLVKEELGAWLLFFAFGEPDNRAHAPNEFLRLSSFDLGARAYVRLFQALGAIERRGAPAAG